MESLRVLKVLLLLTLIEATYSKVNSNDEFLFEVTKFVSDSTIMKFFIKWNVSTVLNNYYNNKFESLFLMTASAVQGSPNIFKKKSP